MGDCRRQASEGHLVRLAQLRGSAERERSPMSPGRESEDSEGRPGTEMKVENGSCLFREWRALQSDVRLAKILVGGWKL